MTALAALAEIVNNRNRARNDISCMECGYNGWGPMLTDKSWRSIVKKKDDHRFMCETCMIKRLGRRLLSSDLRQCPLNYSHPLFRSASAPVAD